MRISTRIALALAVALTVCPVEVFAQLNSNGGAAHGTINIFLANGNGLVAVTDSLISNDKGPMGPPGQKLFKVDDHTICAIAGFFSWSGPTFAENQQNLLPTAVPGALNQYIKYQQLLQQPTKSLATKFQQISNAWALDLNLMMELQELTKQKFEPPEPSILTIAGYEDGSLWIGQVSFVPTLVNGANRFVITPAIPVLKKIGPKLAYAVEGYKSEVLAVLKDPTSGGYDDPIFRTYAKSKASDGGSSLTLDDLKLLASKLETIAATAHPLEVGGEQQIAILSNGNVSSFNAPPASAPNSLGKKESVMLERNFFGNTYNGGIYNRVKLPPGTIKFVLNDSFNRIIVVLDGLAVLGSRFSGSTLFYDGSPIVLFDETNTLIDTDLLLGPKVPINSPFVKGFQKMYPNAPITTWSKTPCQITHSGSTLCIRR